MGVLYNVYGKLFLEKVQEYDFCKLIPYDRTAIVDGYMKRACSQFQSICLYDISTRDDNIREFAEDIPERDLDEIADIVSEGMLVQWMKPYVYKQENYENMLNTTDYSGYSPAELLNRISAAYKACQKDFANMMKDYSYKHGDLTALHS